jgi:ATP-dependent Lhr-like helicase
MEEAGRLRRGFFVRGLAPAQFALPGAEERLRRLRVERDKPDTILIAATDPANPYGAALPWPNAAGVGRSAGSLVVLRGGHLLGFVARAERSIMTFLPESEPERADTARALARAIAERIARAQRRALLIEMIDGQPANTSALVPYFREAGFSASARGLLLRALPADPEKMVGRRTARGIGASSSMPRRSD